MSLEIPAGWWELLGSLESGPPGARIVVIGPSDSGKTTLCAFLGRKLAKDRPVGRVDCDPGQSTVGIPGTVGLVTEPWEEGDPVVARRFVGDTSPSGHFLQSLTGILRLAERAGRQGADRILFDSSGYMDSPAGREFHHQVVDALDADQLVVLGRSDELAPLLRPFRRRERPTIHEMEIPEAVVPRGPAERRAYRKERLRTYFRDAEDRSVDLDAVGHHGHVPDLGDTRACRNLLVGLIGRRGYLLAAGVARTIEKRELVVRAPDIETGKVASVQFGSMRVDLPESG